MKRHLCLFLFTPLIFYAGRLHAQAAFNTIEYIDANKIKAATSVHGDMLWNPALLELSDCEFPKGSGKYAGALTATWMSGYDGSNKLHVSAQTYRLDGNDYWPGPLAANGQLSYANSQMWNKIWKINKSDITAFKNLSAHTVANTPQVILEWPAKGNPYAKGYNGNTLTITTDMAPFVDANHDGDYNPIDGDYPDMQGDQMLWWVFSDDGPRHNNHAATTDSSTPLRIEVQACAYTYTRGTLLDNVIYYDYTLRNRSVNDYSNYRLGLYSDMDLGYALDDALGFDSSYRMAIVYNGKNYDGTGSGGNEYGYSPPIIAITLLHTPGDNSSALQPTGSFMYSNNDFSVSGNAQCDTEYNNYMRSKFRDGMHLRNDYSIGAASSGRGAGPDANYVYSGDVAKKQQWSWCNASNPPADVRFILSTGDYTFRAGTTAKVDFALLITDTSSKNTCSGLTYDGIRQLADTAWKNYRYNLPTSITTSNPAPGKSLHLYPNPVQNTLYIDDNDAPAEAEVSVYDITGNKILLPVSTQARGVVVNTQSLAPGTYQLWYKTKIDRRGALFIKQ